MFHSSLPQNCIDDVKKWTLTNKLKLNDGKTEFLLIGTRQQLAKVNASTLRVGETSVTCSSELKTLGCWLDSQFKFETHITKVCNATFFRIYNIRRIRKFLNEDDTRTLVNASVTNRIDYCNNLLYGLPDIRLKKLQRVQNKAARLICNISRFDHITPILHKLHWLPVKFRIDFKVLLELLIRLYMAWRRNTSLISSLSSLNHGIISDRTLNTTPSETQSEIFVHPR